MTTIYQPGFDNNTLRRIIPLASITRPTGGGAAAPVMLNRDGLLASLFLDVRGSVAGTLSAPNAAGFSSVIKNLRLASSAGYDVVNISGPGYHWLLRNFIDGYFDPVPGSTGRTAVTATTFDISMVLPIALNDRDPLGLINLQNEETQLTLWITWEADATVATGATVTITSCTPYLEVFNLPPKPEDYPSFGWVHQIFETQESIGAAGDYTYTWPRGKLRYLQCLHGVYFNTTPADSWSQAKVRLNGSQWPLIHTPYSLNMEYARSHPAARILGTIPLDFMGSAGFGVYDKMRDVIDAEDYTDLATIITATAAGTLVTVRRMLVPLVAG